MGTKCGGINGRNEEVERYWVWCGRGWSLPRPAAGARTAAQIVKLEAAVAAVGCTETQDRLGEENITAGKWSKGKTWVYFGGDYDPTLSPNVVGPTLMVASHWGAHFASAPAHPT